MTSTTKATTASSAPSLSSPSIVVGTSDSNKSEGAVVSVPPEGGSITSFSGMNGEDVSDSAKHTVPSASTLNHENTRAGSRDAAVAPVISETETKLGNAEDSCNVVTQDAFHRPRDANVVGNGGGVTATSSSSSSSTSSAASSSSSSLHQMHPASSEGDGDEDQDHDIHDEEDEQEEVVQPLEEFHLTSSVSTSPTTASSQTTKGLTLHTIASWLEHKQVRNILILSGAGVSVSAGIPDFRTPGTGLYDNLQKYNLPFPEAVFDVNFYRSNPYPFLSLAKELWPGTTGHSPTITHCFVKLLEQKGLLLRNYTQNIDGLEVLAGVHPNNVLECHGHFRNAHCIDCKTPYDGETCKQIMLNGGGGGASNKTTTTSSSEHSDTKPSSSSLSRPPTCPRCGGYIKPSIVFFGEELPSKFLHHIQDDLQKCDLLLVMGTSLKVNPVARIPELVPSHVPRVLFNRELVGDFLEDEQSSYYTNYGIQGSNDGSYNQLFGGSSRPQPTNTRDVFEPGDCDDAVRKLCRMITGWETELDRIHQNVRSTSNAGGGGHSST